MNSLIEWHLKMASDPIDIRTTIYDFPATRMGVHLYQLLLLP